MFKSISFGAALLTAVTVARDGFDFKGEAYISQNRHDKSDQIWAKVTENSKNGNWHFLYTLFVSQKDVFRTKGDEFDCSSFTGCRSKTVHSVGNVGQVEWINLGGHPYTGIFTGADAGYVRMSAAIPVDIKKANIRPGMGLKFLRDSVDSANLVAMFSVDGQENLNFFENDWSNHVPNTRSKNLIPLEARFMTATKYVQTVGLSDFASYDKDGVSTIDPIFPWSLRFKPTGEFNVPKYTYDVPFEEYLTKIPEGSVLFNIYATDKPGLQGTEQKIGQLKTKTRMVTSYWGDEHMYFRHQLMDDDLKLKPEWEPFTPQANLLANSQQEVIDTIWRMACPYLIFFQ